jgi:hypothetical protein
MSEMFKDKVNRSQTSETLAKAAMDNGRNF